MNQGELWATVIPAYHQPNRLLKTISRLPKPLQELVIVVDDGSAPPLTAPGVDLIRHDRNLGYGAAQKSGYAHAFSRGASHIALIHGDCQYAPEAYESALPLLENADMALGSRFIVDEAKGMPTWRKQGNRLLTGLANRRFQSAYTDLHTGARLFRSSSLSKAPLKTFSDDFYFDHQLLIWAIRNGLKISEFPIPANYEEGVSSISPKRAIKYAAGCIWSIISP